MKTLITARPQVFLLLISLLLSFMGNAQGGWNPELKFDAEASAVAITEGASADAAYAEGVAVFTRVKGGLMYEASIGGQHFTYKSK